MGDEWGLKPRLTYPALPDLVCACVCVCERAWRTHFAFIAFFRPTRCEGVKPWPCDPKMNMFILPSGEAGWVTQGIEPCFGNLDSFFWKR